MKRTIITLSVTAQLLAFGAFAQTSGTSDMATPSAGFGSDWSATLGSAMFAEGGTTVRPSTELTTQWATLSEEDKMMLQRDCAAYMQQSGGTTSGAATGTSGTTDGAATMGTTTGGTTAEGSATTGTAGTATDTTSADATTAMSVSMDQMEEICAATKDM